MVGLVEPMSNRKEHAPHRARLRELLAHNRACDPEFGRGLSNHQSMALTALSALGPDDARLSAFAAAHGERLRPLRAETPGAASDVKAAIGSPPALVTLIGAFERDIGARGRKAVLGDVLPLLLPGISGAAFHGVIRCAYALDAEDHSELAHALAYFVTVAKPLRPLPPSAPSASAAELWGCNQTGHHSASGSRQDGLHGADPCRARARGDLCKSGRRAAPSQLRTTRRCRFRCRGPRTRPLRSRKPCQPIPSETAEARDRFRRRHRR